MGKKNTSTQQQSSNQAINIKTTATLRDIRSVATSAQTRSKAAPGRAAWAVAVQGAPPQIMESTRARKKRRRHHHRLRMSAKLHLQDLDDLAKSGVRLDRNRERSRRWGGGPGLSPARPRRSGARHTGQDQALQHPRMTRRASPSRQLREAVSAGGRGRNRQTCRPSSSSGHKATEWGEERVERGLKRKDIVYCEKDGLYKKEGALQQNTGTQEGALQQTTGTQEAPQEQGNRQSSTSRLEFEALLQFSLLRLEGLKARLLPGGPQSSVSSRGSEFGQATDEVRSYFQTAYDKIVDMLRVSKCLGRNPREAPNKGINMVAVCLVFYVIWCTYQKLIKNDSNID